MSMSPGSSVRSPRSMHHRVGRHRRRRHLDDAVAVDEQRSPGSTQLALVDVEHAGAAQVDGRLRGAAAGHATLLSSGGSYISAGRK